MDSHSADLFLPADEPSAEGHFPGNPIIPGAALLREVVSILSADSGAICCEIRSAKFLHPVRPGDRLAIVWTNTAAGELEFACMAEKLDRRVLTGKLVMRAR